MCALCVRAGAPQLCSPVHTQSYVIYIFEHSQFDRKINLITSNISGQPVNERYNNDDVDADDEEAEEAE